MALQAENQGQVTEFLRVLRKKALQVILVAAFVATLGGSLSVFLPRTYTVETSIELRERRVEKDVELRDPRRAASASEIQSAPEHMRNFHRITETVKRLEWEDFLLLTDQADRHRYIQTIRENLVVEVAQKNHNGGSDFLRVEYSDVDPARAEQFVSEHSRYFLEDIIAIDANRLQEELSLAQNHREEVVQYFEDVVQRRKEILQALEISDAPARGNNLSRQDPVFEERVRVSTLAQQTRESLRELEGRMTVLSETLAKTPREIAVARQEPGISMDAQIATWQAEIDGNRLRLEKYRPGHSAYSSIQAEIELNLQRIEDARARSRDPEFQVVYEPNPERILMEKSVGELEAEMSGLQDRLEYVEAYDAELALEIQGRLDLMAELEIASTEMNEISEARADAERDYTRKKLALDQLKEATESPFAVLRPPLAPENPSGLPTLLVTLVSGVAGLGIGLAMALLGEFTKNCYRSMHDVTRVMSVPVLGVINTITTRAEIRRLRTRHLIIGALSVVVMATIAWFAWAYSQRPELLGTEIVAALKDFEVSLR